MPPLKKCRFVRRPSHHLSPVDAPTRNRGPHLFAVSPLAAWYDHDSHSSSIVIGPKKTYKGGLWTTVLFLKRRCSAGAVQNISDDLPWILLAIVAHLMVFLNFVENWGFGWRIRWGGSRNVYLFYHSISWRYPEATFWITWIVIILPNKKHSACCILFTSSFTQFFYEYNKLSPWENPVSSPLRPRRSNFLVSV